MVDADLAQPAPEATPAQGKAHQPDSLITSVSVDVTPYDFVVRIKGIPHLIVRRSDFKAVHSYIKNVGPVEPIYFIEFTITGREIVCDYKDKKLWSDILEALNDAMIFAERLGEV